MDVLSRIPLSLELFFSFQQGFCGCFFRQHFSTASSTTYRPSSSRGLGIGRNNVSHFGEFPKFLHACEGDAVTKLTNEKIPYFNAPIYLQNKSQIGKVDEIFGLINESYFSVKMMEGIVATSYAQGDKFFIDPSKLLPLARFLPQPKGQSQGGRSGGRGGRGGFRGGRGVGSVGFRGRGAPRGGRGSFRGGGQGKRKIIECLCFQCFISHSVSRRN